jgi:SAM-dependent methyltransferase
LIEALDFMSGGLEAQIRGLLVCPRCRSRFTIADTELRCQNASCGVVGALANDVVSLGDRSEISFFDDRHDVMTSVTGSDGIRCLCYDRQVDVALAALKSGAVVLDVGCGPKLPYEKPSDAFVIGLEASYASIAANREVDMRVYGTAAALPLADHSVDTIFAFYAVHHMTGQTVVENRKSAMQVFREFRRVVKAGGELLVFEVSPIGPLWSAEKLLWNTARNVLGRRLDMFFYSARMYEAFGKAALPDATFSVQRFGTSMLSTFPPVFSLPWLQVPRFLYPFDTNLYRWRF